jgi:vacuolar-type H+-ATPase subunit C/Vma6
VHIETELDEIYTERLYQLQHRLQKPLAQVIAIAIDTTLAQLAIEEKKEPSLLYQAFEEAGLIGCIETDEQLATNYKKKLDFSYKHGESP